MANYHIKRMDKTKKNVGRRMFCFRSSFHYSFSMYNNNLLKSVFLISNYICIHK